MNNRFWIESIRFTGENVADTVVTLKPGINIVHGPSDTGKTYLAKSIKYMLAGSTKPFPAETGYSTITMVLRTEQGKVTLKRGIGSTRTTVSADHVFNIPLDDYAAQPTENNANEMTVSDILLRLIGINERKVVLTNQYGSRAPLTWKSFAGTLHRSEGRITSEESIFSTAKYATLSAFLTLFYDHDLSLQPEHEDPAFQKTRKEFLAPHLEERLNFIDNRLTELQDHKPADRSTNVSTEITELSEQLSRMTAEQDGARRRLATITSQLTSTEQELSVRAMSAHHYDDLASVYVGNIKRLTFVADAQNAISNVEAPAACPFCDAPLEQHQEAEYKNVAQVEAEAIVRDLEELSTVRTSLDHHVETLQRRIQDLRAEQKTVENQLSTALLPRIKDLSARINSLREDEAVSQERELLEAERDRVQIELTHALTTEISEPSFDPAGMFPQSFYMDMTRYIQEILHETHFEGADQAIFDANEFDIRIRHKAKRSHGKGYRAFFNTIVVLALRRYIFEHATHKPSVIVLDTPTLGLEHQKSGSELVTSRDENGRPRTGLLRNLYDHMVDTGKYGQLIILNNTDVTPTTRFNSEDTTELVFGEHDEADRPGLLIDMREGDENHHTPNDEQLSLFDKQ
ncbi:seryl-tRNA synthetase [Arcanobacterium wilhelmae]|uniref:Nuclease SbcCD subunit C n=1 Tax=Arcanobacterium wilhelmae TaxID=1803177 RepID=A0ABT9NCQ4_9ACTO|nr:AAA family ATPase [Arcanobacterium wilhelmae]MDP9801507.1 seryl-tRNA synthetase [Arcanobacterium wilhelmae]